MGNCVLAGEACFAGKDFYLQPGVSRFVISLKICLLYVKIIFMFEMDIERGYHVKFNKKGLLIVTVLLALMLTACGGAADENDAEEVAKVNQGEVVAVVNGEEIYEMEFQRQVDRMIAANENQGMVLEGEEGDMVKAQIEDQIIQYLVQQQVLLQEAHSRGLEVTDEEVEKDLEMIKDQFGSKEAFEQIMEDNLFTEMELKETLRTELTIEALLEDESPEVTVDEEELREYYSFYEMQYEQQMAMIEQEEMELSEEEMEMMQLPSFEEMKEELRQQITMEKQQEYHMNMVDELMEASEIEILL